MVKPEKTLRWMPLDNAAKIYPAARRRTWSNVFRLSVTLTESVDVAALRKALAVTVSRFPSIAVRLRRGVFWYYLQQLDQPPEILEESSYPLTRMDKAQMRKCALRVIVYEKRIALEFFHSLTDGTGGMVFLKTLLAEYLQQKYGLDIPVWADILDRREPPREQELEDSFGKFAGPLQASRRERDAWRLSGTPETSGFLHLTCFTLDAAAVLEKAHQYGVTLTAFLTAAMMQAIQQLQKEMVPEIRRRKPVKVLIPVNLRSLFPSSTLRNFAMYVTPEILPRLGEYSFPEICQVVRSKMEEEITPKQMSMKIAANVASERLMAVRILPLFVKNIVMKAVFDAVGERKSCLSLSNLGRVCLPEEMAAYVERLDFILSAQAAAPYNCGVLSYGENLFINFIRNTKEPRLEQAFYEVLRQLGLQVQVQTNGSAYGQ